MLRNRIFPTAIVALVGAIIGSFVMMLYASTHFTGVAGPNDTPPAVSAAPLTAGSSDQERIIEAVRHAKNSVVAIDVTVNGQVYRAFDPFFQQFFGQQGPGMSQPYRARDSGSGFVYDREGDIVTNAHVVQPPMQGAHVSGITVVFADGHKAPAHLVAANVQADLAIIRVNSGSVPAALPLGNSQQLQQGQWAIAIGEPYELQSTVTLGVISAFNRSEPIQAPSGGTITFKGLLQTSAPINPGNSGGPLIDINGNVVGVNQSTLESGQGIGFAIPSNMAKQVIAEMLAHPGVTQGTVGSYLGVYLVGIDNNFRQQTGYHGSGGAGIYQVLGGGPADAAGLQPGDVILSVNDHAINSTQELQSYLKNVKPGTHLTFQVWSQGNRKLVSVVAQERPAAIPQQ